MLHECCLLGPCLAQPELVCYFLCALAGTFRSAELVTVVFPQLEVD